MIRKLLVAGIALAAVAAFVLLVYVIDTRITRVAETPPAGLDTTGAPGDIL